MIIKEKKSAPFGRTIFFVVLTIILVIIFALLARFYIISKNSSGDNLPNSTIKTITSHSQNAQNVFDKGDNAQALKEIDAAIEKDSSVDNLVMKSKILANIGVLTSKEDEYSKQAQKYTKKALEIAPKNVSVLLAHGYTFEIIKDYQSAITEYEKASTVDGKNAQVLNQLGHVNDRAGDITLAKKYYILALKQDSQFDRALVNIGRVSMREGDRESARGSLGKALKVTSNMKLRSEILYMLSIMDIEDDNLDTALDEMEESIKSSAKAEMSLVGSSWVQFLILRNGIDNEMKTLDNEMKNILSNIKKAKESSPNKALVYFIEARILKHIVGFEKESLNAYNKALNITKVDGTIMENDKASILLFIKNERDLTRAFFKESNIALSNNIKNPYNQDDYIVASYRGHINVLAEEGFEEVSPINIHVTPTNEIAL